MTALCKAATAFLAVAQSPRTHPYIHFPFPSELDTLMQRLVMLYPTAAVDEQAEARSILTNQKASDCFHAFVLRAATQGVRQGTVEPIFEGLMALVIEDLRSDPRETVMRLSVIINAVVRIGANPIIVFRNAVAASTPRTAELLEGILSQYQDTKNSALMGHRTYNTPDGFSYY